MVVGIAIVALAVGFGLPLLGLLWRTPWSNLGNLLADENARTALWLSLVCSTAAADRKSTRLISSHSS